MILNYLILENIRSYVKQKIEFPKGSILLSGDIGSGKSTVLLSIEFALFGLLRGEISGSSLLRHGEKSGSVELCFQTGDNKFTIKRLLKRNNKSVEQDFGHIICNNSLKECTPIELKSEVLRILGYPPDIISKSKNTIYRYTVFTPQEDMKKILFDSEDERINILRKVFNIDKYKTIQENCESYTKLLREKRKNLEGKIFDLDEKLNKSKNLKKELESLGKSTIDEQNLLIKIKQNLNQKKSDLDILEKRFQELKDKKKELASLESEIKKTNDLKNKFTNENEKLKKEIIELQTQISLFQNETTSSEQITLLKNAISEKELLLQNNIAELARLKTKINDSENTKDKIQSINSCLLCLQEVSSDHKKKIIDKENENLAQYKDKFIENSNKKNQTNEELKNLKDTIEKKQKQLQQQELSKIKKELLNEKNERSKQLLFEINELDKNNLLLSEKTSLLKKDLEKFTLIEIHLTDLKKDFDTLASQERNKEIEFNKLIEKSRLTQKISDELNKEILEKQKFKENIEKISKLEYWLKEYFISLAELIERHVMSRIYQEFNELFKQWFSILIEDELLTVQLNDSFTPIIQQNGYDSDIESLSGGEKTACALAYRLALNKVINSMMSTINTKDIIILDEPTDGFSSHQLDKIRDVLNELNMKQIIIVSHEQKIESFVDYVIKVSKNEHISKIA